MGREEDEALEIKGKEGKLYLVPVWKVLIMGLM